MSYDDQKSRVGRQPVQIVELDLDTCVHTYGTAPCTAAIGVTGTDRCYKARKTCQDPTNYLTDLLWDPLNHGAAVVFNAKQATLTASEVALGSLGHDTGKWYAEVKIIAMTDRVYVGLACDTVGLSVGLGTDQNGWAYGSNGTKRRYHILPPLAFGITYGAGDVVGIAFDASVGTLTFFVNNVSQGSFVTLIPGTSGDSPVKFVAVGNGGIGTTTVELRALDDDFDYAPPAGYVAWGYATSVTTYRFSNLVLPPSSDPDFIAIPAVDSVSLAPTVIDPINGIGKRASVMVSLNDFPHSDIGVDPYVSLRSYDPSTRGTYWTKLLARNPYYQNRIIRVKIGYLVDGEAPDADNFQTRLYLLQRIEGPDTQGMIRVTAQDPLKLLDDARAKGPVPNTGTLLADISEVDFAAQLIPAGIGDAEYPTSGVMVMGQELAAFTRVGDAVTFTSRGANYTAAIAHQAGEPMQAAMVYSGQSITEVLYDLLVNRAGISSSYIDLDAWNEEVDTWLADYEIGTIVVKPTGLAQLVGELAQQCLFYIWWDERTHFINLKAIRPVHNETVPTLTDASNVLADTQSVTDKPDDRKTQYWIFFGQKNPLEDLAKSWNYFAVVVAPDADAESTAEYGDSRIGLVFSRWLPATSRSEAERLSLRLLNRYRDNPKLYAFKLDAKDSSIWTGDVVEATIRSVVDFTGAPAPSQMQVLQVSETKPGSEYQYTLQDTQFKGRYAFWAPDDEGDYLAVSEADRERYAFWADDAEVMSDGAEGYRFL